MKVADDTFCSNQNRPDDLVNIILQKAYLGKNLMEKCFSDAKQQLPFKYFAKFQFISKLFSKV